MAKGAETTLPPLKLRTPLIALAAVALVVLGGATLARWRHVWRSKRAQSLMAQERWAEAEEALQPLSTGGGVATATARFNRALALYHVERYAEARELLDGGDWAGQATLAARAAYNAGNCAWRSGDRPAAAARWRDAVSLVDASRATAGAEALAEVKRRALHNLALLDSPDAAPPKPVPQPSPPSPDDDAETGPDAAPSSTATPDAAAGDAPAPPANAARPGAPETPRDALEQVLSGDTGPVLTRPAGRARKAPGDKDW